MIRPRTAIATIMCLLVVAPAAPTMQTLPVGPRLAAGLVPRAAAQPGGGPTTERVATGTTPASAPSPAPATSPASAELVVLGPAVGAAGVFDGPTASFLRRVNADALGLLGVQYRGRVAILDTLAREQLDQMYGSQSIDGLPAAVAYLEIYLNSGPYACRPLISVHERNMRGFLLTRLAPREADLLNRTGHIPPAMILDEQGWQELIQAGRAGRSDVVRAAELGSLRQVLPELSSRPEFRVAIDRLSARYSSFLTVNLLRVAPAEGELWLPLESVLSAPAAPATSAGQWRVLARAWHARDADAVNRAVAAVGTTLAATSGCPSLTQRKLERLYDKANRGGVMLVGFAVSAVLLILAAGMGAAARSAGADRRWPRWAGLGVFAATTLLMLAIFIVRWLISGRVWYLPPLMNQYEAVFGSILLGALLSLGMELFRPRNYFALAAAFYGAVALLAGLIFPEQLESGIRALPGILSSPVMAVHVSVIIIGHALAGMTLFISLGYLGVAAVRGLGDPGAAVAGSPPDLRPAADLSPLAIIDRCNLTVAQLAAWFLIAGTLLGAYWGDFAWGRWWGWDPKETWALITCLIYVAVLHVRLVTPVRRRGLLTALICLVGSLVMIFNWVVVNYVLTGKHSYA
jgi:ABC-type transport system involved in cytochrome c biogenesis permease subunit